jgi:hypothetical protein
MLINLLQLETQLSLCVFFFDRLVTVKHNMLQQVRYCKAKSCKNNPIPCEFRIKYQKCETCIKAIVYEAYEHSVSVTLEKIHNKRGIDDDVKIIINNCIQRSAPTIRPCDVFVYLNLDKTRNDEMKGHNQPTLAQIQYYLRNYCELTLGSRANTTEEIRPLDLKEKGDVLKIIKLKNAS